MIQLHFEQTCMTKFIRHFFAFIIFLPACPAYGQSNDISGDLSGSTTVYANQISDPQNQQTVIMTNGAFSPSVSDTIGSASSNGSNSILLTPRQLTCNFEGDLRVSGQTGALPVAGLTLGYEFTLSTPDYISLNGTAQISRSPVSSSVTLQNLTGGGTILCQYGQGNVNPGTQPSGNYEGFVQAGTYRLLIQVEVGDSAPFTSAESLEADYNAFLSVGDVPQTPEPSTWMGGALLGSFLAASTVRRLHIRRRLRDSAA